MGKSPSPARLDPSGISSGLIPVDRRFLQTRGYMALESRRTPLGGNRAPLLACEKVGKALLFVPLRPRGRQLKSAKERFAYEGLMRASYPSHRLWNVHVCIYIYIYVRDTSTLPRWSHILWIPTPTQEASTSFGSLPIHCPTLPSDTPYTFLAR